MTRRVAVVGGGISGLAAAWELTGGAAGPHSTSPEVLILEASERLGGAVRSDSFGGRVIDLGPDGFLGRRPEAYELCREVGVGDSLVPVGAQGAGVWARGKVRPLPDGLALGVPTRFWPAVRSGILGWRGASGLARDALVPRPDLRGPIGDRSVGPLVARKLGQRVVDLLVDPLIGGIHAGSVEDMSAAAAYPSLLAAAQHRGGLMRGLRAEIPAPMPDPPPLFWAVDGGLQRMVDRLGTALSARGCEIRYDANVEQLERKGFGWSVATAAGVADVDDVVIALPAHAAARLVRPHDDDAASLLDAIDYAAVGLVTFRLSLDSVTAPLVGTGFLVPRRSPHPQDAAGWAVTACTYLSRKWPHLQREGDILIRASVGRQGDERFTGWSDAEVAARVWDELATLIGVTGSPLESLVVRFPDAFPQYRMHHLMRTAGIESAGARLGHLSFAGAAYRGVGIPACIASGRAAARALL